MKVPRPEQTLRASQPNARWGHPRMTYILYISAAQLAAAR